MTCGTLFVRQLPPPEGAFDYTGYYRAENLAIPEFVRLRIRETLGRFEGYRQLGRLFDVGFGAGAFLDEARALGWQTAGVEASGPPVAQAKAQGHDVRLLSELESFSSGTFDVVVATEVVEHVEEPLLVLDTASRLLRPGGLLYLTTPAGDGLNGRLLGARWSTMAPPEHLALFSARGLALLLARGGFRVVESRTSGLNPFELLGSVRAILGLGGRGSVAEAPAREVNSAQLNELAMSNPVTSRLKSVANSALGASGLGDTLKVFAERI
ncbi:MAG: class I SAM-dependent methyltransferase [Myxococcaceae bacterium]|jgi:SAM-dependent methyltransferase|nr:class I SAM-dependent methyltransferase [Myxococcaceae bacterium]